MVLSYSDQPSDPPGFTLLATKVLQFCLTDFGTLKPFHPGTFSKDSILPLPFVFSHKTLSSA